MEKHRNNPTCFECHRKSILWVFPWNIMIRRSLAERYAKRLPIDGSGKCQTANH